MSTEEEECLICFENISNNSEQILECNHKFHENCITNWYNVSVQKDCPICRTVITTIEDNNFVQVIDLFNKIFFSWQRSLLLLLLPINILFSIVSLVYYENIIICIFSITMDTIGYIGIFKLNKDILYNYLSLWFCKILVICMIYRYNYNNENSLRIENKLVLENTPIFLISEFINIFISVIICDIINKINYYRERFLEINNII